MLELSLTLCNEPHPIPQATDGAVFENQLPANIVTDIKRLRTLTRNRIMWIMEECFPYEPGISEKININLYVNGPVPALVEVIRAFYWNGVDVTLWHYDERFGEYYPQDLSVFEKGM